MKIALAQINPTIGDFAGNTEKMMARIEQAVERSCGLIVFSELVLCGYPPGDLLNQRDFLTAGEEHLDRVAKVGKGIGVVCGAVTRPESEAKKGLFNSALLLEEGDVLYGTHKRVLRGPDIFNEAKYFVSGDATSAFLYKGISIGLTVGDDLWDERDQNTVGADLIINISASPYSLKRREHQSKKLGSLSKSLGIPLLRVNQTGGNGGLLFDGASMAFDAKGTLVAQAADFDEDLIVFDTETQQGNMHSVTETDLESMLEALVMGTRDYAHKSGFRKALVGISGGIDSAVTAAIAVKGLGRENLTALFMPSPYTSPQSYADAEALTKNLKIELIKIPIEPIFDQFSKSLSPVIGERALDVTEQNLQARVRATILMALSNRFGHLVLATGNKSELAVGYCTLYGDLSGGLAVISDVSKTKVYELAHLINKDVEVIPTSIIERAPTAELKPDQKDHDDLPPYDILDGILKAYVEESKGIHEIAAMGFDPAVVADVIQRVDQNEYKRYQAPPGLKVTDCSFGVERRFPLVWHR